MDISGFVVLGIVTLFLVYLMPQLIRSRQDVIDARVDDRFSGELRILATAGSGGATPRPVIADGAPRAYLHRPSPRTEVSAMNRPLAQIARSDVPATRTGGVPVVGSGPDVAARAAARAATARRKAAARRRLVLTLVLLALAVGGWSAVGLGVVPLAVALVPTVLLVVVLVLGRRAATAGAGRAGTGARTGASPQAGAPAAAVPRAAGPSAQPPRARPAATGTLTIEDRPVARTHRASRDVTTEVMPRVGGLSWRGEPTAPAVAEVSDGAAIATSRSAAPAPETGGPPAAATGPDPASAAPAGRDEARTASPADRARPPVRSDDAIPSVLTDDSWTPVPVPAPTYTLKAQAPRMESAPLVLDRPGPAAQGPQSGAGSPASAVVDPASAGVSAPEATAAVTDQDALGSARSLDLNAVLARRRAAGE